MSKKNTVAGSWWTCEEVRILKELWSTSTEAVLLAALPGRSMKGMEKIAQRLGLPRTFKLWNAIDTAVMASLYAEHGAVYVAALLNRPPRAVAMKAQRMGLKRLPKAKAPRVPKPRIMQPRRWTAERLAAMREHYPAHGCVYVAELIGSTARAVNKQASKMGLKRIRVPKPVVVKEPRTKVVQVKPPKAPKPAKPAKEPKLPVAKAPAVSTPNLNAQKALRARSEEARKFGVVLTAAEIRKLPYNNPLRQAHMFGGDRGVREFLKQQPR